MNELPVSPGGSSPSPGPGPKARGLLWFLKWSAAVLSSVFVVLLFLNFRLPPGPNSPAVAVSPQTTHVLEPLKPNGDVDYIAWLNRHHSAGVTPQNNAFVELLQVIGPRPEGSLQPPEFYRLLGAPPPPDERMYLRDLSGWTQGRGGEFPESGSLAEKNGLSLEDLISLTGEVPFLRSDIPETAGPLKDLDPLLEKARRSVEKTHWYIPYCTTGDDWVFGILLPFHQQLRTVARSLQLSCMRHLGEGAVDAAIDDAVAVMKLGHLAGRNGFMVELLIGMAVEGTGRRMAERIVFSGHCTDAQLQKLEDFLREPPGPLRFGRHQLVGERLGGLDHVVQMARSGRISISPMEGNPAAGAGMAARILSGIQRSAVDWESVLIAVNGNYDRIEEAISMPAANGVKRIEAADRAMAALARKSAGSIAPLLSGRGARGKAIGEWVSRDLQPAIQQVLKADLRNESEHVLLLTAIAAERYRIRHGRVPGSLPELVPEFLPAVPLDPCSGGPLVYRPAGRPFTLYSVGTNGVDDQGVRMEENPMACDFVAGPRLRTVDEWLVDFRTRTAGGAK